MCLQVVMDLWLEAGSAKSFPVVLELLLDMIYSDDAELQERAFNIVYNLTLHAQLLRPADQASMAPGCLCPEMKLRTTPGHGELETEVTHFFRLGAGPPTA